MTRDILIRVAFIHKMRKLREPLLFAGLVSLSILVSSAFFVSFGSVMDNSPAVSEITSLIRFVVMAFLNTELFVQVAGIALLLSFARYAFLIVRGVGRFGLSLVGLRKVETALS